MISAEEAEKQGTAPVQLRESCRYSYEIEGVEKGHKIELEPNRLISRYKNVRLLETRASAGRLHLHLTEDGKRVATGIVEIRSIKLDHLEEYRGMLRRLAEDLRGYIFDLGALTSVPMVTEWSEDAPSLAQQVEYLRKTLAGREFRGAMAQILPQLPPEATGKNSQLLIEKQLKNSAQRLGVPARRFVDELTAHSRLNLGPTTARRPYLCFTIGAAAPWRDSAHRAAEGRAR